MILNPLPRDLALAEFDFMNCEAAMLKVCKLDINWAAEGWGAARVGGFFSLPGDVRRLWPRGCSGHPRTELDTQRKLPKTSNLGFWAVLDDDGQVPALAEPQRFPLCTLGAPALLIHGLSSAPHLGLFSLGFDL